MKSSYWLVIVFFLFLVGAITYLEVAKAKARVPGGPSSNSPHLADDERLLGELITPTLTSQQVKELPVYSDFERTIRERLAEVAEAVEVSKQSLTAETDYIERYPVDGVQGQFLAEYKRQNERWGYLHLKMINDRIRAIKNLDADLRAFYLSNPDEATRMSNRTDEVIKQVLEALKPGPQLVKDLQERRDALATAPDTVRRSEYESARSAFENWNRGK